MGIILENKSGCGLDSSGSGYELVEESCEQGNELSGKRQGIS
jgi:hypothetical protein